MASGQDRIELSKEQAQQLAVAEKNAKEWLKTLTTPGIRIDSTNIYYDDEARRVVTNKAYRDSIYRQPYTMRDVSTHLTNGNIRLAFYVMINLYPQDQARVLQYISAYDQAIEADKLVNSAFYTYAMLDPRITSIDGPKPEIHRPDIMDELFHYANEISAFVLAQRQNRKTQQAR